MPWIPGRQGGGYLKWPLFRLGRMDAYLIKYPTGAGVRYHTDPVEGRRHFRLNIVLKKPEEGGEFRTLGRPLVSFWRVRVLRPDLMSHTVKTVTKGERLVLSIGVAI